MKRVLVLAAVVTAAASGCTGSGDNRAPQAFASGAATAALKDALIFAAVKARLTSIDTDSATTLGVAVHDGAVTLHGTVRDARARDSDIAAARKVAGVTAVVSNLRIDPRGPRPGQQLSDAALATRVTAAFTAQVGLQRVAVHVDHGVVTLDGPAKDARTKATIEATARGTAGVRSVVDHLRIEPS